MPIPLMKHTFLEEDTTKEQLCEFIRTAPRLSMGDQVATFETEFASWLGRRHCVMVNSGSSANLVVLQALLNLGTLQKGDKVGLSAVTWATNVMPVIQLGLTPCLIDIDLKTLNISPEQIPSDIRCLFITHLLGFCTDMYKLRELCEQRNILLLEDTCESLGAYCAVDRLGTFGLAATFSTFVGHHMSTIEGGLIVTNDPTLADMLRMVRAHGWDRNVTPEARADLRNTFSISDFYGPYTFYTLGYNVRPTEIQGFLGRIQLRHLDSANQRRRHTYAKIRAYLQNRTDVQIPEQDTPAFAIPILCKDVDTRDKYLQRCHEKGIEVRPIVAGNMARQPFFRYPVDPLPNADIVHTCGFYMPNHPDLTEDEQSDLCDVFAV